MFEIPRAAAGRFAAALKRTASGEPEGEGGVRIEPVQGTPREAAKQNRRSGPPPARHHAKPHAKTYRAKPAGRP
jgi:ATP-dependent RNA helicase DeaD